MSTLLHQPQLNTVIMVEKTVKQYSGELGNYQLWRKLPKSIMYQTYLAILDYLEYSNKIAFDKRKKIAWIFNSKLYDEYIGRDDLGR